MFLLPENAEEFPFEEYDYVVDAVDTVTAKIELVMKCKEKNVPIISSMGAGNKLDASAFRVADIYKTKVCPLAKVMRRELKKRGVKKLKVVYSEEQPTRPLEDMSISCRTNCICPPGAKHKCTERRDIPGSVAFVPSVAGLIIAGEVIKDLAQVSKNKIRLRRQEKEMSISIEELNRMNPDSYQIIDIRDETEIGHGAIPGAVAVATEEIEGNEKIDFSKKLVICCSRGKYSVDVAEELSEKGIDAESLEGGYIAWLIDNMKQKEAAEKAGEGSFAKDVEQSLRKKFRKSIWCKFTKAINEYELVKPGDKIAVCISGGKDSMLMAKLFQELKRHNKFDFEVKFLVMDPGYSPANRQVIEENAKRLEIPIEILSQIFLNLYTM